MYDQLVVPQKLISYVLHPCHDQALSRGHPGFRPSFDKIRSGHWRSSLCRDDKTYTRDCQGCIRRKTAHHRAKFPVGHLPVQHTFQRVSVDLVEYNTISKTPNGFRCKFVMCQSLMTEVVFPSSRRFPTNRVKQIREYSLSASWGSLAHLKDFIRIVE